MTGWDFGGASVEGIDWGASAGSAVDIGWSDGGAFTSSIDRSGESSQWVTSTEVEDSTSGYGHRAKSHSDTLDSLPSLYLINGYE